MTTEVSATEAARRFSDLLNAVKYRHDSFMVMRGGKPAAAIVPVDSLAGGKPLKELGSILNALPTLNTDNEAFSRDLDESSGPHHAKTRETSKIQIFRIENISS